MYVPIHPGWPTMGTVPSTPRRLPVWGVGWAAGRPQSRPESHSLPFFSLLHCTEETTSPFLREVQVNLIDFKKCNNYLVYNSDLTPRMMCAGDLRGGRDSCQVRLLPRGAQALGPQGKGGSLRLWGRRESQVPTVSCPRAAPLTLLMRVPSPVGRQRGAPGLRAGPPLVPGRSHQLGHWLWPEKQTRRVHQSDGSPPLDIQQNGGESPAGCVYPAGGDSQRWGAWKRA